MALKTNITQTGTSNQIVDAYCKINKIITTPNNSVDIYVGIYNAADSSNALQSVERRLYNCISYDACWDTYFSETTLKADGESLASSAYNFLKNEEADFTNSTDV